MKQYSIIILILILFSCKTTSYNVDKQLPVRSFYPSHITKVMSSRQKKYIANITAQINQERAMRLIMDIGALKNGKLSESYTNFRINYIRYSPYETAEDRATLTSAYKKIRTSAKTLNLDSPTVYWSPVASTSFAAFTTPLRLLNPKLKDGAIIEISNGIESNLFNLSNVLINLAAHTYEKIKNDTIVYAIDYRTKDSVDYIFKKRKVFQNTFNRKLLSYFFHEKDTIMDSIFFENKNFLSPFVTDDAINFICQHEYSHVLLKHINQIEPVRFSMTEESPKANRLDVGIVNFKNELQADSLALVLGENSRYGTAGSGVAIALIWLDITERINEMKYRYNVHTTHPPAKARVEALLEQMKKEKIPTYSFDNLFYCYNLLWKDFEPVLIRKIADSNYNYN